MIFNYFRYISSTWYFNLRPDRDWCYFPIFEQVKEAKIPLHVNSRYQSKAAQERDLAYRAFQIGYINRDKERDGLDIWQKASLPTCDEYRFLRKNFHPAWVVYTLAIRILSLHNPIREIRGYWESRDAQREDYAAQAVSYPDYNTFRSPLLQTQPLVSVIIPTLNRYSYLENILEDLEKQTYSNFEVIIIDQSTPFQEIFFHKFSLNLNVIYQPKPALWLARNTGILNSNGDIILFSEDDVRVMPNWIEEHLKCLDYFKTDISNGVFFPEGSAIPKSKSFFKYADQFATGNACLYKSVFDKTGLFDRTFEKQRMGDGEFGLRAYLKGIKSISNPFAYCLDVKAPVGGLRQMGSWDAFRPKSFWAPRPVPSVLYLYRKYYGNKAAVLAMLKNIPPSITPYTLKRNKISLLIGTFFSLLLLPIIIIQVYRSWLLSSRMLRNSVEYHLANQ